MDQILFKQLESVRNNTLRLVEDVTEKMADRIPTGFRNNIRWNLGHIYLVQERFAFYFSELPMQLPTKFNELFANGTTPLNWTSTPPTLAEITSLLREQQGRIRSSLENRLNEKVKKPYTTSTGLTLETIGEFINFNLYHEGMHFSVIKLYKSLIKMNQFHNSLMKKCS